MSEKRVRTEIIWSMVYSVYEMYRESKIWEDMIWLNLGLTRGVCLMFCRASF
jgi:hypothetical protein